MISRAYGVLYLGVVFLVYSDEKVVQGFVVINFVSSLKNEGVNIVIKVSLRIQEVSRFIGFLSCPRPTPE